MNSVAANKKTAADPRAQALRANLQRRKEQSRMKTAAPQPQPVEDTAAPLNYPLPTD